MEVQEATTTMEVQWEVVEGTREKSLSLLPSSDS